MKSYPPLVFLGAILCLLCFSIQSGESRRHLEHGGEAETTNVQALKHLASQSSDDVVNNWMLTRRDLLNITIDTDRIDEQPLTTEELLMRMKLIAYVQKLVDKEEKKKAKVAKKAEKAKAKAALLGLPEGYWGPPPPVTVSPPGPIPTAVNLSGSEPLPPTGFWLYKKAEFLSKLFGALAEAAATLPGVTTEPPVAEEAEDADTEGTDDEGQETVENNDEDDGSIVNVNDKRSVDDSDEYDDDYYEKRVYVEPPRSKVSKSSKRPTFKHRIPSKKNKHNRGYRFRSSEE